jgi:hypothetical protein
MGCAPAKKGEVKPAAAADKNDKKQKSEDDYLPRF